MRLLATADLHYNHGHSHALAKDLIDQINGIREIDAIVLVGDTASGDGPALEECLARFAFAGPKLFVPGNHELWTKGPDSFQLLTEELPSRVRQAGWHYLQDGPALVDGVAVVGSIGWYDYSYAPQHLGIPRRFFEHKVSPGAAERLPEYAHLLEGKQDVPAAGWDICARWNDGRFAPIGRSDEEFLRYLLDRLDAHLRAVPVGKRVVAAVHHVPFEELLPPSRGGQWDFARAYLGTNRLGELLLKHPQVSHVLCGHSHAPAESQMGHLRAINIGSGYRKKGYRIVEV